MKKKHMIQVMWRPPTTALLILLVVACTFNPEYPANLSQTSSSNCPETETLSSEGDSIVSNISVFFDRFKKNFTAWNHLDSSDSYGGLARRRADYVAQLVEKSSHDCKKPPGSAYIDVVLVKSLGGSRRRYSNGLNFKRPISSTGNPLTFSEIRTLTAKLDIDPKKSTIPSNAALRQHFYGGNTQLSDKLQNVDSETATIGFTIYGKVREDGMQFYAEYLYDLDYDSPFLVPNIIHLPIIAFTFYEEKNHQKKKVTINELAGTNIEGIRIIAESTSGRVLRDVDPALFDVRKTLFTDFYKELAVRLHYLALLPK